MVNFKLKIESALRKSAAQGEFGDESFTGQLLLTGFKIGARYTPSSAFILVYSKVNSSRIKGEAQGAEFVRQDLLSLAGG